MFKADQHGPVINPRKWYASIAHASRRDSMAEYNSFIRRYAVFMALIAIFNLFVFNGLFDLVLVSTLIGLVITFVSPYTVLCLRNTAKRSYDLERLTELWYGLSQSDRVEFRPIYDEAFRKNWQDGHRQLTEAINILEKRVVPDVSEEKIDQILEQAKARQAAFDDGMAIVKEITDGVKRL